MLTIGFWANLNNQGRDAPMLLGFEQAGEVTLTANTHQAHMILQSSEFAHYLKNTQAQTQLPDEVRCPQTLKPIPALFFKKTFPKMQVIIQPKKEKASKKCID